LNEPNTYVLTSDELLTIEDDDGFHSHDLKPGWHEDIALEEQVDLRLQQFVDIATDFVRAAQTAKPTPLTQKEIAAALRTGAATRSAGGVDLEELEIEEAPVLDGLGDIAVELDSKLLWGLALQFSNVSYQQAVAAHVLPAFYQGPGTAHYHAERGAILLPPEFTAADVALGAQEFLDNVGRTRAIAELVREKDTVPGKKVKSLYGRTALAGRWIDLYDGIVDEECVPYLDMAAARFAGNQDESLAAMWSACPSQVGLYLATMEGAWV
jgi:hypothetical protein